MTRPGRPRVRGSIPWELCKRTAKLLRDAARITARANLPNLSGELSITAKEWEGYIDNPQQLDRPAAAREGGTDGT